MAQDGLNQPSTLPFGTAAGDQQNLYLLNFSVFQPNPPPQCSASGSAYRGSRAVIDEEAFS